MVALISEDLCISMIPKPATNIRKVKKKTLQYELSGTTHNEGYNFDFEFVGTIKGNKFDFDPTPYVDDVCSLDVEMGFLYMMEYEGLSIPKEKQAVVLKKIL